MAGAATSGSGSGPPTGSGSPTTSAPPTGATPPPSTTPPPPVGPAAGADPQATVLRVVNEGRSAEGCDDLVADADLAASALQHSEGMHESGELGVRGRAGAGLRTVAVAQGASDPAAVAGGWLADPAVRAVLLDCRRTAMGVGTVDGWWTTVLE
jgi:uncharacterized protein YkwD